MISSLRVYKVPTALLAIMSVLMVASSWSDSAIMDELAHVPAGYANAFLQDYRLNPEHPPLAKLIAALPLAFTDVAFPTNTKSWTDDINGQWTQGAIFLYESGNDPDAILRLMRLPMMALAILFGWLLWSWARRNFGRSTAHLALFAYAFSPTFIAHSRFVTTDLAAAFAFFIGIISFLRFLKNPSPKNVLLAGLAFGLAQLLKFSLILLIPVYGILLLAWTISRAGIAWRDRLRFFGALSIKTIAIIIVAMAMIWIVYAYTIWNYPAARQYSDAEYILTSFPYRSWVDFDLWLIRNDLLRPLGQYVYGLLMVLQRASGGNTQYFLGDVSAAGDIRYFPLLYLMKEPLAFHVLSLTALWFAARRVASSSRRSLSAMLGWIRDNFSRFAAMSFIAVYWATSLSSSLNIGVRHVLPTLPFIFILIAHEISAWLAARPRVEVKNTWQRLGLIYGTIIASVPRYIFVCLLLLWTAISVIVSFPNYLSYYNALGGGTANGYLIGVDSNYDWGQDLKRLALFTERSDINNIAVDYFGGGNPAYYFGSKFVPWWSARGYPPGGGWFAISATFQMGAHGNTVKGFRREPKDSYEWLKPFRPVARAGKSIFIYRLPENPPPGL